MIDETRTPEPAADSGSPAEWPLTVGELKELLTEVRQENTVLRRKLEQIAELVKCKLHESRKHWWERRRALHELGEELIKILELSPAEPQPVTPKPPSGTLATRSWKRWMRKHPRKSSGQPPESPPP